MAGASSDGEVNHWPAFVDVLTTVIMVVTFLLVIMSAAVMVLSQKIVENVKKAVEQKYAAELRSNAAGRQALDSAGRQVSQGGGAIGPSAVKSPSDAPAGTSAAALGAVLKSDPIDGRDQLTIRTRETPETLKVKVKAMEEPSDDKGVEVKTADLLMRVDFEPTAVRYPDDVAAQMVGFLKAKQQDGMTYEIWSFVPQTTSISEAQRVAFYRAAMTRNLLIAAGIAPNHISTQIRVTDPADKDGHNVRVVLKP